MCTSTYVRIIILYCNIQLLMTQAKCLSHTYILHKWLHSEWHSTLTVGQRHWQLTPTEDWQLKTSNALTLLTSINEQLYLCTSRSTTPVWPLPAASITGVMPRCRKHKKVTSRLGVEGSIYKHTCIGTQRKHSKRQGIKVLNNKNTLDSLITCRLF